MASRPSADLEALKSGRLGVQSYLRARLARAMEPLRARLSARQFRVLRRLLQTGLAVDPLLLRFVQEILKDRDDSAEDGPRPGDHGGVR